MGCISAVACVGRSTSRCHITLLAMPLVKGWQAGPQSCKFHTVCILHLNLTIQCYLPAPPCNALRYHNPICTLATCHAKGPHN